MRRIFFIKCSVWGFQAFSFITKKMSFHWITASIVSALRSAVSLIVPSLRLCFITLQLLFGISLWLCFFSSFTMLCLLCFPLYLPLLVITMLFSLMSFFNRNIEICFAFFLIVLVLRVICNQMFLIYIYFIYIKFPIYKFRKKLRLHIVIRDMR